MRKWIVFRAEKNQPGWKERRFQHTQSLTKILAEHFDSSDNPTPEPGYRPLEFIRVEQLANANFPGEKTHYRKSDWVVSRVETYTPDVPMGEFDMIVICHCKYSPIKADLKPMPEREISPDSFGGDTEAYERWLQSQSVKQPAQAN
ncbi:MAG: hypothetical protein ACSI46_28645 [Gloeotrichia echinulata DVL01]|jgi:hypothetical protein|nr:hypothetical protein [Gloeotrichia echinulata DEX184]